MNVCLWVVASGTTLLVISWETRGKINDILFVISAVIAFMIVYLLFAAKRRNKYDERQTLIRNRGYKYAFITVVVCNLLLLMLVESFSLKITPAFLLLLPIVLGMYVAAGYSI